jgi:hypothetical protein
MADRYWVGGTANWDFTAGTKWATTSGGAGGASVPTLSDDVYFDAASGAVTVSTVSVQSAKSLNFTGFTGTFNNPNPLQIYGDLTFGSGMTFTGAGQFRMFTASGATSYVTSNGVTTTCNLYPAYSAGGTTVLNDAFSTTASIVLISSANGTFTTNNFNVTCASFVASSNNATINLGSSVVAVTTSGVSWNMGTSATLNAGTSTINITNASGVIFEGGGKTYNNVNFSGGGANVNELRSANTFNNLSFTATVAGARVFNFAANQTINGTLSASGTTWVNRIRFGSSVAGTQRTLSVATIGTLDYTDWQDIALTGAASPWTAPLGVWGISNTSGIRSLNISAIIMASNNCSSCSTTRA